MSRELDLYNNTQSKAQDHSWEIYKSQQDYGAAHMLDKLVPYNYKDYEKPESASLLDAFRYSNYAPRATGRELQYAKDHPVKSKGEFLVSRLMLPDVVSKKMFPSINEDYKSLPMPLAAGLLGADAVLTLVPGVGKAASKLIGAGVRAGFSAITHTGIKMADKTIIPAIEKIAAKETLPLLSEPSKALLRIWHKPTYANIQSDGLDAMVHRLNRRNILFRSFDLTLPGTKQKTHREMLIHAYKELVGHNDFMKKYGLQDNPNYVFKKQMQRFFGAKGKNLDLGTASSKVMKNALIDMAEHGEDVAKGALLGKLSWVRPVRKVMGLGEQLGLKTYTKGYVELNQRFAAANMLQYRMIERFQNMAAANKLGVVINKVGKATALKLRMTRSEIEAAGKLVHDLDKMARVAHREGIPFDRAKPAMQIRFNQAPVRSQALAQTYRAWADEAYFLDFWIGVDGALDRSGMSKHARASLQHIIDQGKANMQFIMDQRTCIFDGLKRDAVEIELNKLRQVVLLGNSRLMFPYLDREAAKNAKKVLAENLQFEKKGVGSITNYLDNYAQRIGERQDKHFAAISERLGGVGKADYSKHRVTDDFLSERFTTDIRKMVEARASMQSKDIELKA